MLKLKRELRVSADMPCEEGVVIAAEVLNNKNTYNQLELTSGRMAVVKRGDIVVGALGHYNSKYITKALVESLPPAAGATDAAATSAGRPRGCPDRPAIKRALDKCSESAIERSKLIFFSHDVPQWAIELI